MKKIILPLAFAAITLTSCNNNPSTENAIQEYYNIDSLINAQVTALNAARPQLIKVGNNDSLILATNEINWEKELGIFKSIDLNKPAFVGAYTTQDGVKDSNSNLTIKRYQAKESDLSIQQLDIYYLDTPSNIRKLKAITRPSNVVFQATRDFELAFEKINNTISLSEYSISSHQKMAMRDSVAFSVNAKIIYP